MFDKKKQPSVELAGEAAHASAVAQLRASFEAIPAGATVRLAKKTSNLFRPREKAKVGLDVSGLTGVISIDADARTADVQGMCTYENLVDAGIIDPVKVTRSALTNAASIASMVLTTDTLVVEKKEEEEAPAAGGHGHSH